MDPQYIIVQAGGKGTRLGHLTANKPKALVPIGNLPMLFHLFRQFPDAKFIVIADYQADVMRRYLAAFAQVRYLVVNARGAKGTCGGIRQALEKLPPEEPFMLIWSDLVLPEDFRFPEEPGDYIGLSKGFPCRWRYQDGVFEEIPSSDTGVAGLFLFQNRDILQGVPSEGEFVRWLQQQRRTFKTLPLARTEEFGLLERVEEENRVQRAFPCRPFNRIEKDGEGRLVKTGIDAQGEALAVREKAWYRLASEKGFKSIPKIYAYEPLTMQCIDGKNIFAYTLTEDQQRQVLEKLVGCLRYLHSLERVPADAFSIQEAYIRKTWNRLDKVRDLIPFAYRQTIVINGKKCRNVFFHKAELEARFENYPCSSFALIHGDSTFSNMMLNEKMEPVLIDPRGYFGYTELYGDPLYDWAKLYYSIVGNYDQFNLKRFTLTIGEEDVKLDIASNGWERMESEFFRLLDAEAEPATIRLLHAIIWLSLTTYAWEDYDSICGAFYNGLYYLEDVL